VTDHVFSNTVYDCALYSEPGADVANDGSVYMETTQPIRGAQQWTEVVCL